MSKQDIVYDGVSLGILMSAQDLARTIAENVAAYKDAEKRSLTLLTEAAKQTLFSVDCETSYICDIVKAHEGLEVKTQLLNKYLILTGSYVLTAEGKRFASPAKGLFLFDKAEGTFAALQKGKTLAKRIEFCRSEYTHYWRGRNFSQIAVAAMPKPFGLEQFAATAKAATTPGRDWKAEQRRDIFKVLKAMTEIPALAELLPEEVATAVAKFDGRPVKTA